MRVESVERREEGVEEISCEEFGVARLKLKTTECGWGVGFE